MQMEPGERRDFLPRFVERIARYGIMVFLEKGYGCGMQLSEDAYRKLLPEVQFVDREQTFTKDIVIVLRYPGDDVLRLMRPGACLISMLHYPTRPQRVGYLRSLAIEAISLDSLKDDTGRRLVENLRAVAWNGMEAAFQVLAKTYPAPGFFSPERLPIHVTLLGAGAVGVQVVQAAIRHGDDGLRKRLYNRGVPGVQVTVVDYDLTNQPRLMHEILARSDILADATQRADPTQPVIPNEWIAWLPQHAVLVDLSVDPYDCDNGSVKGLEGIPQGNLDQYIFSPDDPVYEQVPGCVPTRYRRFCVSCYSWPGVHPEACMEVYGKQLQPILRTLVERGGVQNIRPDGKFFERAISRALLSRWSM
jgi:alanine dehydrogenase